MTNQMTFKQKLNLDALVNQCNEMFLQWVDTDYTDMALKKKLDDASKLLDEYELQLGPNDDDCRNQIESIKIMKKWFFNKKPSQSIYSSKVVDAINALANKLGLGDERTITECYEYNVRQYEGRVNDGIRSVDFDINLSDKYVCRINRDTRDRFDYLDI